ncbi:MAG: hypothetical protein Q9214_006384, partial [Letrouitia sp. 1 TL-2023]
YKRRRRTSGNGITKSPATESGSRRLKHVEANGQINTDASLAATRVSDYTNASSTTTKTETKSRERRNKRKREDQSTALHRPAEGRVKAFQEAGLPSNGHWNLSHQNKAKRISQMEVEPDKRKLVLFDFRKAVSKQTLKVT